MSYATLSYIVAYNYIVQTLITRKKNYFNLLFSCPWYNRFFYCLISFPITFIMFLPAGNANHFTILTFNTYMFINFTVYRYTHTVRTLYPHP